MKRVWLRWLIVLLLFFGSVAACFQLTPDDSVLEMLPGGRGRQDISLLQRMGLVNRIFISIGYEDSGQKENLRRHQELLDTTDRLGKRLAGYSDFSSLLYRVTEGGQARLMQDVHYMLPFLFTEQDQIQLQGMASPDGIARQLERIFIMLNSPAGIGLKKQVVSDPLQMGPLVLKKLRSLQADFTMKLDGGYFVSQDDRHTLLVLESRLPLTDSKYASRVDRLLESAIQESLPPEFTAIVIGSIAHTLANSRAIRDDLTRLLPLASVGLLVLLLVGLKSVRGLLVFCIPFLAAPTAVVATWLIHGNLSGMALGFGIVLLGIGVDFGVHLYLALQRDAGTGEEILRKVMRPVLFASLTTCGVFVVLLFSEVSVHRQMATLALIGLILAVAYSRLLIPTIVRRGDETTGGRGRAWKPGTTLGPFLLVGWLFFVIAGGLAWTQLRYNGDLRHLDVKDSKVMAEEQQFSEIWSQGGQQKFIISSGTDLDEALERNDSVRDWLESQGVKEYQSVAEILPGPSRREENVRRYSRFWAENGSRIKTEFEAEATRIGMRPQGFTPFWQKLKRKNVAEKYTDTVLDGALGPMLATLIKHTEQESLVLTVVSENSDVMLHDLEAAVPGARVIDPEIWRQDIEQRLQHDLLRLSLMAGGLVLGLVWLQFKSLTVGAAVIAPVVTALSAMGLYCFLTGEKLNMMHMVMSIMVIGLAVDYGIFIVCARGGEQFANTARGVSICAASSLLGFGVLALAVHPALHSLGVTVLVGVLCGWPVALFVTPLLLHYGDMAGGKSVQGSR